MSLTCGHFLDGKIGSNDFLVFVTWNKVKGWVSENRKKIHHRH